MREEYMALVRRALESLGGNEHYVPGAKLLQTVQREAELAQFDFHSDLRAENLRFGDYLETLAPQVKVHKRGPADMLVGLETAHFEIPESRKRSPSYEFRQDVYRAFVRRDNAAFTYKPDNDEF